MIQIEAQYRDNCVALLPADKLTMFNICLGAHLFIFNKQHYILHTDWLCTSDVLKINDNCKYLRLLQEPIKAFFIIGLLACLVSIAKGIFHVCYVYLQNEITSVSSERWAAVAVVNWWMSQRTMKVWHDNDDREKTDNQRRRVGTM